MCMFWTLLLMKLVTIWLFDKDVCVYFESLHDISIIHCQGSLVTGSANQVRLEHLV